MRYGEIYKISTPRGVYIGQCLGWATGRWSQHLRLLREDRHHCRILQESYDIDGLPSFSFSILETSVPEDVLDEREYAQQLLHADCISAPPLKVVDAIKRRKIYDRIKEGVPYRRIAAEFSVSNGTVGNVKQQYSLGPT